MLEQIFYYNLTIFKINDFSLTINALVLLFIFLISLKIKNPIFKRTIYLLILIGFTNIFVFNLNNNTIIDLNVISKISFFIYNIFNHPIGSLNTFFMVHSYLNIIIFIPFYLMYNTHKVYFIYLLIYIFLQLSFVSLNIASLNLSLYFILLNTLGYLIGFSIKYFKGGEVSE